MSKSTPLAVAHCRHTQPSELAGRLGFGVGLAVATVGGPGSGWGFLSQPQRPYYAAWSAFSAGAGAGQDHSGGAGIIEANDQLIFTPFPCHRHPASVHPQRDADRALPPGPSRSTRPSRPVRSAARHSTLPGSVTGGNCPEFGAPADTECGRLSVRARARTRRSACCSRRSSGLLRTARTGCSGALAPVGLLSAVFPLRDRNQASRNGKRLSWRRLSRRFYRPSPAML